MQVYKLQIYNSCQPYIMIARKELKEENIRPNKSAYIKKIKPFYKNFIYRKTLAFF